MSLQLYFVYAFFQLLNGMKQSLKESSARPTFVTLFPALTSLVPKWGNFGRTLKFRKFMTSYMGRRDMCLKLKYV